LIAKGVSNAPAAIHFFISEPTIESRVTTIAKKLGTDSRVQVARCVARAETPSA
jgi:DNA-binding NarL/FixJ family response regulator